MQANEYDYSKLSSYGFDIFISHNVEIRRPSLVTIGNHVAIDSGFYLTTAAEISNYIHIGPYVTIIGGATAKLSMGNFTSIAAGARLICLGDQHLGEGLVGPTIPDSHRDITVGGAIVMETYSSIGTNAIIFPGVRLGEGSVIGAGAVLTKDTEPWTIYVGNPARAVKKRKSEKLISLGKDLLDRM